jgi:hypothetical protein
VNHGQGAATIFPTWPFYDGQGHYLVVAGEVKLPSDDIKALAFSEERNDQIGRYLAQTGVVLVSNVRMFGLLTVRPMFSAPPLGSCRISECWNMRN